VPGKQGALEPIPRCHVHERNVARDAARVGANQARGEIDHAGAARSRGVIAEGGSRQVGIGERDIG
jgi:hypothetical protein